MTKIYEALEQAGQDRLKQKPVKKVVEESFSKERTFSRVSTNNLERPLGQLYQNIQAILPDKKCRTIQLVSARSEEGTSILTEEFAKFCVWKYGKKVLLVKVGGGNSRLHPSSQMWMDTYRGNESDEKLSVDNLINQIDNSGLHLLNFADNNLLMQIQQGGEGINEFFSKSVVDFDYIFIDVSSRLIDTDYLLISTEIDGVILVVEAEKTRWHVVERLNKKIVDQGGKVLGVLFNKRKFYIPKFLYNFL